MKVLVDCDQIWCVFGGPLAMHFTLVMGGVQFCFSARACLFRILVTTGRIAPKFGGRLGVH